MSDFLFAYPSFLSGAARVVDLFGVFDDYNFSPDPATADYLAALSDRAALEGDEDSALQALIDEYSAVLEELNAATPAEK